MCSPLQKKEDRKNKIGNGKGAVEIVTQKDLGLILVNLEHFKLRLVSVLELLIFFLSFLTEYPSRKSLYLILNILTWL